MRLTPDAALRLEAILGLPAEFWNNLEAIYQEKRQKAEEENAMDENIELARKMPYAEMAKPGWIEHAKKATPGIAYRRTGRNDKSGYILAVRAQKAKLLARDILKYRR